MSVNNGDTNKKIPVKRKRPVEYEEPLREKFFAIRRVHEKAVDVVKDAVRAHIPLEMLVELNLSRETVLNALRGMKLKPIGVIAFDETEQKVIEKYTTDEFVPVYIEDLKNTSDFAKLYRSSTFLFDLKYLTDETLERLHTFIEICNDYSKQYEELAGDEFKVFFSQPLPKHFLKDGQKTEFSQPNFRYAVFSKDEEQYRSIENVLLEDSTFDDIALNFSEAKNSSRKGGARGQKDGTLSLHLSPNIPDSLDDDLTSFDDGEPETGISLQKEDDEHPVVDNSVPELSDRVFLEQDKEELQKKLVDLQSENRELKKALDEDQFAILVKERDKYQYELSELKNLLETEYVRQEDVANDLDSAYKELNAYKNRLKVITKERDSLHQYKELYEEEKAEKELYKRRLEKEEKELNKEIEKKEVPSATSLFYFKVISEPRFFNTAIYAFIKCLEETFEKKVLVVLEEPLHAYRSKYIKKYFKNILDIDPTEQVEYVYIKKPSSDVYSVFGDYDCVVYMDKSFRRDVLFVGTNIHNIFVTKNEKERHDLEINNFGVFEGEGSIIDLSYSYKTAKSFGDAKYVHYFNDIINYLQRVNL
ncbi:MULTISPECIES: hypothetical protein [Bacillus]|uniref:Uncharacterized protein n=1 Tax=Bacillus glycinifermentans TaxID=1664069 RepID=A0A0T6BN57_9BACI|nr:MULTISPECIES: hypothetical protein [Bacillus]KRT93087.1 hypothetical protein AB447_203905 [Bacillus glycinifermentans]MEC0341932.1 hypothetical protein [Bacillus sonorensis]MEC0457382.1 hypothetical protein [Bacillus sonorensis]MEC0487898.1 hypothetical protein [Bacillus glycinifermentans]MEC0530651.1 hypothetical protein [Bacillus sonorensis]